MGLFSKRSAEPKSALAYYLCSDGCLPSGYTRLMDSPEIAGCIDRMCEIVSSATLRLMENTKQGDKRVKDALSRFVDISPWEPMGTRTNWVSWIVATMIGPGDGNACCLPHYEHSGSKILLSGLEPMPGASLIRDERTVYKVIWQGREYDPDEIVHFRLFADTQEPWRGRGYKVQAARIAASLKQTGELKDNLSSPAYKPPLIVAVSSDADLGTPAKRDSFRKEFLESTDAGKPWIIQSDLMNVTQAKPLTLNDLAIKDTVELDKRTAAAIFGMPPFLVGIGGFNQAEYNNFVRRVIIHICNVIEQELTAKLLISTERYFKFNRRHLYAYDIKDLISIELPMADRGYINGDEVREHAMLDPAGLTEYHALENYIPYDLLGAQNKLVLDQSTGG